jgi:hypothetical protein
VGSISEVWHWLIDVPFLGAVVLGAVILAIFVAGAVIYDAWAQYNRH